MPFAEIFPHKHRPLVSIVRRGFKGKHGFFLPYWPVYQGLVEEKLIYIKSLFYIWKIYNVGSQWPPAESVVEEHKRGVLAGEQEDPVKGQRPGAHHSLVWVCPGKLNHLNWKAKGSALEAWKNWTWTRKGVAKTRAPLQKQSFPFYSIWSPSLLAGVGGSALLSLSLQINHPDTPRTVSVSTLGVS